MKRTGNRFAVENALRNPERVAAATEACRQIQLGPNLFYEVVPERTAFVRPVEGARRHYFRRWTLE